MKTTKAIVIDKEKYSRERIRHFLYQYFPSIQIIAEANTVASGSALIQKNHFDLLFLDIQLPDGNGFDILNQVSNSAFDTIFITAQAQHALPAIKSRTLDYLLKPLDQVQFQLAVEKFLLRKGNAQNLQELFGKFLHEMQQVQITLPTLTGFKIVDIHDILRLESDGSYTIIHCLNGNKTLVSKPIKIYENILPPANFCRIHHSHIVNIHCIKEYIKGRGGQVVLIDGSAINVSENRRKELLKYWQQE